MRYKRDAFPVKCDCGAVYPTQEAWERLPFIGIQTGKHESGERFADDLELRNCACGSSRAVNILSDHPEIGIQIPQKAPARPVRNYSRLAFWTVKLLMLVSFLLWYGDKCEQYNRAQMLRQNLAMQYQANGIPYFWNGSIYLATDFDFKRMTVRVKKEASDK